jgi:hypothetical protein
MVVSLPEKGWSTLNARLYSILGHPLGMPLVLLLDFLDKNDLNRAADNTPSSKKKADKFQTYLNEVFCGGYDLSYLGLGISEFVRCAREAEDRTEKLSTELAKTISTWYESGKGETILTASMAESLQASRVVQGTTGLLGIDQNPEKGLQLLTTNKVAIEDLESGGRYDILLTAPTTNVPVALFEVGLQNSLWWSKLGQAITYVDILSSLGDPVKKQGKITVTKFGEKPMIMCVLTLDQKSPKDRGSDGDNFKIAAFLCHIKDEEMVYTLLWH